MANSIRRILSGVVLLFSASFSFAQTFVEGRIIGKEGQGVIAVLYLNSADPVLKKKLSTTMIRGQNVKIVQQRHKQFQPRIIAIRKDERVRFVNEDRLFHNVFSVTKGNAFDLGLFKRGEKYDETNHTRLESQDRKLEETQFKSVGKVNVFCNIHPSMSALVIVVDHPFYAESDQDGNFRLLIPATTGKYDLQMVDEAGAESSQSVDLKTHSKWVIQTQFRGRVESPTHTNKLGKPYSLDTQLGY